MFQRKMLTSSKEYFENSRVLKDKFVSEFVRKAVANLYNVNNKGFFKGHYQVEKRHCQPSHCFCFKKNVKCFN